MQALNTSSLLEFEMPKNKKIKIYFKMKKPIWSKMLCTNHCETHNDDQGQFGELTLIQSDIIVQHVMTWRAVIGWLKRQRPSRD